MTERSSNDKSNLAGSLLLAHPSLQDPNFRRTVVLISNHDQNGAMGLVLNRPMGKTLGELDSAFELGDLADVPLYCGGPVKETQLILCAWKLQPDGSGFELLFGLEPEKAIRLREEAAVEIRAFLGYSGWTEGQLEGEIQQDGWVVVPLQPDLLGTETEEGLWRHLLGSIDDEWKLLAEEPDDPSVN